MRIITILLVALMVGCQSIPVTMIENEEGIKCGVITDLGLLMPLYVVEKDSDIEIGGTIPHTPIELEIESEIDREIVMLAEKMNNDVIAIRSVLLNVIILRNLAPCNEANIKYSWQTMDLIIKSMERHYTYSDALKTIGEKNAIFK